MERAPKCVTLAPPTLIVRVTPSILAKGLEIIYVKTLQMKLISNAPIDVFSAQESAETQHELGSSFDRSNWLALFSFTY